MIDGLYVHLLQKRAMYGIDPAQRLRLLRHRLGQMTDPQFHAELLRIFTELRDLHTNYILPRPYQGPFAFLGILLEQHWENGEPRWMVSKVFDALTGDPHLVAGAEVTHWNGSPIALAVARNAELEAGSNPAARMARGVENMTLRATAMSPPPDEDWVDLRYSVDGSVFETRIPWRVFDGIDDFQKAISGGGDTALAGVEAPASHLIGLDLRTELVRAVKKRMFAPGVVAAERRMAAGETVPVAAGVIPTTRPEIAARTVTTAHGTFGHLRIFTFAWSSTTRRSVTTSTSSSPRCGRCLSLMPRRWPDPGRTRQRRRLCLRRRGPAAVLHPAPHPAGTDTVHQHPGDSGAVREGQGPERVERLDQRVDRDRRAVLGRDPALRR